MAQIGAVGSFLLMPPLVWSSFLFFLLFAFSLVAPGSLLLCVGCVRTD